MNFHFLKSLGFFIYFITIKNTIAQAVIDPPFGMRWGDSPEKLIRWATSNALNTSISLPGDQPATRIVKIYTSKGFLPKSQSTAIEGYFLNGQLYELTVHYSDPEASADLMESRFNALRKQIIIEHGNLVTNQLKKTVKDQFVSKKQSFHQEPVKGLFLLLAFTEVEDLLRQSKMADYSLIYRNENLKNELFKISK
jgi:hypothetical protein